MILLLSGIHIITKKDKQFDTNIIIFLVHIGFDKIKCEATFGSLSNEECVSNLPVAFLQKTTILKIFNLHNNMLGARVA